MLGDCRTEIEVLVALGALAAQRVALVEREAKPVQRRLRTANVALTRRHGDAALDTSSLNQEAVSETWISLRFILVF